MTYEFRGKTLQQAVSMATWGLETKRSVGGIWVGGSDQGEICVSIQKALDYFNSRIDLRSAREIERRLREARQRPEDYDAAVDSTLRIAGETIIAAGAVASASGVITSTAATVIVQRSIKVIIDNIGPIADVLDLTSEIFELENQLYYLDYIQELHDLWRDHRCIEIV